MAKLLKFWQENDKQGCCECRKCDEISEALHRVEEESNIDLCFYTRGEHNHLYLFYNFQKIVQSQLVRRNRDLKFMCRSCFHTSSSILNLTMHKKYCLSINKNNQKMKLEKKGMQFKINYINKMIPKTAVSTFDCEMLILLREAIERSYEQKLTLANSMAITTLLYDPPNENDPPKVKSAKTFNFLHEIFDGPSALVDTFNSLKEHNQIIVEIEKTVRKHYLSHKLTPTEESDFQVAQICNLCLKSLEKNPEKKAREKFVITVTILVNI